MKRLELYKCERRQRKLVFVAMTISIMILVIGLTTVDTVVNSMLGVSEQKRMIMVTQKEDSIYQVSFMNLPGEFNLRYIRKDLGRAAMWFEKEYGSYEAYLNKITNYTKAVMSIQKE